MAVATVWTRKLSERTKNLRSAQDFEWNPDSGELDNNRDFLALTSRNSSWRRLMLQDNSIFRKLEKNSEEMKSCQVLLCCLQNQSLESSTRDQI